MVIRALRFYQSAPLIKPVGLSQPPSPSVVQQHLRLEEVAVMRASSATAA
jgi:hypothetical protein